MSTQRQDHSGKKSLSSASKRPDAFWSLIIPSACLEKGRLDSATRAYPTNPQMKHGEELQGTQPVVFKEKRTPHAITKADATGLYPHLGVTPEDKKPVIRREEGRPEPTDIAQPAHHYISLTEHFRRTQPVKGDENADDGELSEDQVLAPTPALHKGDKDEEFSEGPDDTERSDGDEDYVDDHDEDDSETGSDVSSPATQRSQLSYLTPRRASARSRGNLGTWLKEVNDPTAPKRKTPSSQPASAKGRRPRKRSKFVVEDSDEESDEEGYEEEAAHRSVPQNVARLARARAQGQNLSILPTLPPLSRQHQPWSKKEEETLFSLRIQGKSWRYVGERALGRTASGARGHWDYLRTESLKPVETRAKGRRRRQKSSVVSAMAEIPKKNNPWSKEEEGILINLRAQGKSLTYVCGRIPGKGYGACKIHWRKIKDQYPQAVTASKDSESDGKGCFSDRQDGYCSLTSQLDLEAEEAESKSRSATVECEAPKSSTNGDSPTNAGLDTLSANQPHQRAAKFRLDPMTAGGPRSNTASANQHQQQEQPVKKDGDLSSDTDHSEHQDQPNTQPVINKKKTPETKKAWSVQEDRLLISLRKEGRDWIYIAGHILGHTDVNCEKRYETMRSLWSFKES